MNCTWCIPFLEIKLTALRYHVAVYDIKENCGNDKHYFFSGCFAQLQTTNQIMLTSDTFNPHNWYETARNVGSCHLLIFSDELSQRNRGCGWSSTLSNIVPAPGFHTSLCSFWEMWFFLSEISRRCAVKSGVFGLNIILLNDGGLVLMFLWRICNYTMISQLFYNYLMF